MTTETTGASRFTSVRRDRPNRAGRRAQHRRAGGTSATTTAPAPTTARAPMRTLGSTIAPAPTVAPHSTVTWPPSTTLGPSDANDAIVT